MTDTIKQDAEVAPPPTSGGKRPGPFRILWRSMRRSTAGFIGCVVFFAIVLVALIGPFFTPDQLATNTDLIFAPPSFEHILGTDSEGRDIAVQMINGGRPVIFVGLLAAMISTTIAVIFGALAAYLGRWFDSLIVTITDIVVTVPQIVLLAVLAAFYKLDSPWLLALLLGLLSWPALLRAVRAQVFSLKEREYVEAARLVNLGTRWIVLREILPNMASFILMNFVIAMTNSIYALVGLYFLGLAPLSGENWGIMLKLGWTQGAVFNSDSLLYILAPVLAISILQLALVTMTRSFEEILNPRLRDS